MVEKAVISDDEDDVGVGVGEEERDEESEGERIDRGDDDEDEDDEEGQDEYEDDGFIVSDVEEEEEQEEEEEDRDGAEERQKKKKRRKRESERNYVLDEDDYVLLQESNISVPRPKVISGAKKMGEKSCPYFEDLSELFSGGGVSYEYGQSSTFKLEDSDEDKDGGDDEDVISLGDNDDDSPMTGKTSSKRQASSGPRSQGKEASRFSKKSKCETSSIATTLKLISYAQQARIDKKNPAQEAAEIIKDMNLDDASFLKAFTWITASEHNCLAFIGLSDELRRKWIQSLP